MIKVSDGMLLSFQGQSFCHGTTIHHHSVTGELCPSGVIFGIHFGLSMPNLTAMHRLRIDQYMREMCITPRLIQNKYHNNGRPFLSLPKKILLSFTNRNHCITTKSLKLFRTRTLMMKIWNCHWRWKKCCTKRLY